MKRLGSLLALLLIAGCTTHLPEPDVYKKNGQLKPTQSPYNINDTWYYPQDHYTYEEEGMASWYGPGFHGRRTSTGVIFDENKLTAAHNTLPLPCIVRVTNLDNGRVVDLEVNDRGPFACNRILDVSRRGAQLLGFINKGTARVRIQCLPEESRALNRYYKEHPPSRKAPPAVKKPPQKPQPPQLKLNPLFHLGQQVRQVLGKHHTFVQLGTCDTPQQAKRLTKQCKNLGKLKVTRLKINGKYQYRVLIGPIANVAQAEKLVQQVAKLGVKQAKIVVKEEK